MSSPTEPPSDPRSDTPHGPENMTIPTGRRHREDLEKAPFWKEVAAFRQMPRSAYCQYDGQYVAVYDGRIVDADSDEGKLALRFYRDFGYVPVYIHKVGTEEPLIDAETL